MSRISEGRERMRYEISVPDGLTREPNRKNRESLDSHR